MYVCSKKYSSQTSESSSHLLFYGAGLRTCCSCHKPSQDNQPSGFFTRYDKCQQLTAARTVEDSHLIPILITRYGLTSVFLVYVARQREIIPLSLP